MDIRINVYHHFVGTDPYVTKLNEILTVLKAVKKEEDIMTQQLVDLQAAVAENAALDDSIIQLVNGLAAQILELKDDPAALEALATEVKAKSALLAAAIQANTPAA